MSEPAADRQTPVLELSGVEVAYGALTVLHGVSLAVGSHESVALIGANGAGKSTVLRAVAGFVSPRRGSITLAGEEIGRLRPHQVLRRGCAYVAQGQDLFPGMTVQENVEMGGYPLPGRQRVRERVGACMDLFPMLREKSGQRAGGLSGGERQQLKIARALMTEPRLLLLDEPSAGLSPLMVEQVFEDLNNLRRDTEVSILLVEQNIVKALEAADRACVLELGVVATTSPARHLAESDVVRGMYLGAASPAAASKSGGEQGTVMDEQSPGELARPDGEEERT